MMDHVAYACDSMIKAQLSQDPSLCSPGIWIPQAYRYKHLHIVSHANCGLGGGGHVTQGSCVEAWFLHVTV